MKNNFFTLESAIKHTVLDKLFSDPNYKPINNIQNIMEEETFLTRLQKEQEELNTKVEKLWDFISSESAEEKVGAEQYGLLLVQYSTMKAYRDILIIRIHKLTN